MQLIYCLVGAVCLYVLFECGRVWLLLNHVDAHQGLTHFAQHQVLLIGLSSLFCVALCVITALVDGGGYGWLSRWWAMFDVFVCIIMLSQLKYLKTSLAAGG